LVALTNDAETGADGLAGRGSDKVARVSQTDPDEVEDEADIGIHESRGVPGKLTEDKNSTVSLLFDPVGLEPFEGRLNLRLDKLRDEGSAWSTQLSQGYSSRLHRHEVLAPQHGLEIRSEAGILGGDINAIEVDERIEGIDAAQSFGRIIAVEYQVSDLVVDGVVKCMELFGGEV
jgi:hypothetical protein